MSLRLLNLSAQPSLHLGAPAFEGPQKPAVHRASVVRFSGKSMAQAGKNGVWVTVERIPCKVGGLGEVSKTIPEAIRQYSNKDIRVMVPYLAPMKAEHAFQPTGVSKQLVGPDGQLETFDLLQKFEPIPNDPDGKGVWVYAVGNEKYFGRFQNIYLKADDPNCDSIGKDAMFKSVMMYNRAAAALLPELNASHESAPGSSLKKFDGDASFVIAHDWLSGPLLSELPADYQVGKLFMLHNTYDEARRQAEVDQNRLKIPEFLSRKSRLTGRLLSAINPHSGQVRGSLKEAWSPLSIGIKSAEGVIGNLNYVRTITLSDFAKGRQFVKYLREKLLEGKVFDMHHGISSDYSPYDNPALRTDGFTELKQMSSPAEQQAEMKRFLKTNQQALQKKLGLKVDDGKQNYVVMNWVARFDPYQKGFYLLMNEAEDFLRSHPNVQLAIVGANADNNPTVAKWIDAMNAKVAADPALQGRLYLPNKFVTRDLVVQINAGSDFTILPSLYEPYGLTQLECIKLGSIPVVHGVDGLRSTVSEPGLNGKDGFESKVKAPEEKVWGYGQTGILMEPVHVAAYRKAISSQDKLDKLQRDAAAGKPIKPKYQKLFENGLSPEDHQTIATAQKHFRDALERALKLGEDENKAFQVRMNGIRYVDDQHNWEAIVPRYVNAIDTVTGNKPDGNRLHASA